MCLVNLALPDPTNRFSLERPGGHPSARQVSHPRLKRLLAYLELHPSHRFTTGAAAKAACLQENYFCTLFKRETGQTFVNWQRAWRVARIAEVLVSESIAISHAAERYGYLNMRAFERAFKAVYQVSAREFRREFRRESLIPATDLQQDDAHAVQ
jgi:transcriptional regulator GlxA family with amidase domain